MEGVNCPMRRDPRASRHITDTTVYAQWTGWNIWPIPPTWADSSSSLPERVRDCQLETFDFFMRLIYLRQDTFIGLLIFAAIDPTNYMVPPVLSPFLVALG